MSTPHQPLSLPRTPQARHQNILTTCSIHFCSDFLLFKKLFIYFWPRRVAYGTLVPRPGIEPTAPAVEAWSLNHWTTREVPLPPFIQQGQQFFFQSMLTWEIFFTVGALWPLLPLSHKSNHRRCLNNGQCCVPVKLFLWTLNLEIQIIFVKKIFYWSIVDLPYCVSFRCTAQQFSYTYIRAFFCFTSLIGYYEILSRVPGAIQ